MICHTKRPDSSLFSFYGETLVLFNAKSNTILTIDHTGKIDDPVFGKERDKRKGFAFWEDITAWV